MSAGGGCEAAITVRTRCGWVKNREYNELLHGSRFSQKLKVVVYKTYVRPTILCGSKACLRDGNATKDNKIHSESNVQRAAQR